MWQPFPSIPRRDPRRCGANCGSPFPILCDTERRLVKEWDIYNPREKGGIAKPSVFVIGSDRVVRFSKVDSVATRIPPSEIIRILRSGEGSPARGKTYIPHIGEFYSAIRRALRR